MKAPAVLLWLSLACPGHVLAQAVVQPAPPPAEALRVASPLVLDIDVPELRDVTTPRHTRRIDLLAHAPRLRTLICEGVAVTAAVLEVEQVASTTTHLVAYVLLLAEPGRDARVSLDVSIVDDGTKLATGSRTDIGVSGGKRKRTRLRLEAPTGQLAAAAAAKVRVRLAVRPD